ncbi:MAG: NAD-dependent deacylase [Myxococcota bacterium]|nr:NAD-dependent deacylase [Myxococcota bacterium]
MNSDIEKASQLVAAASSIVAFTGAGISAESGIPTYRGAGGLWTEYDPAKYANIDYFLADPAYYWRFFKEVRYPALIAAKPNRAHLAIAELEAKGQLRAVITQNIDGLHGEAGSKNIIELHGNTRKIGCLDCDADYGITEVYDRLEQALPPPCPSCGGRLKPRVVFFGESLPAGAMENAALAASECDLLLVVGSTLEVYPAASLPGIAKQNGANVIIVNVGQTALDHLADIRIDAKAGEVLSQITGS